MAKKQKRPVPADALFDGTSPPSEAAFREGLGPAFGPLHQILGWLARERPAFASEWKYAPLSGWYRIYSAKKRRLLYLVPHRRGFRLVIVLGDRAIGTLTARMPAGEVDALMAGAKRYPEGTAFTLESKGLSPEAAIALLRAKLEG